MDPRAGAKGEPLRLLLIYQCITGLYIACRDIFALVVFCEKSEVAFPVILGFAEEAPSIDAIHLPPVVNDPSGSKTTIRA